MLHGTCGTDLPKEKNTDGIHLVASDNYHIHSKADIVPYRVCHSLCFLVNEFKLGIRIARLIGKPRNLKTIKEMWTT